MEVTIYSHNFAVTGYNRYGYQFLKQFGVNNFGEVDFRAMRINGMSSRFNKKPLPVIKRTYAVSTANGREFRFHRNCLDMFKEAVSKDPELSNQVTYNLVPMYTPLNVGLKLLEHWSPRENQIPLIGYFNSPGQSKILNLQTGGGKEQLNSELVLTTAGWKTIGSIKIGDVVICPDNKRSNVIGVFPQGKKAVYRITFEDGRTIDCGAKHLWKVYKYDTCLSIDQYVADTLAISAMMAVHSSVKIPLPDAIEYPDLCDSTIDFDRIGFQHGQLQHLPAYCQTASIENRKALLRGMYRNSGGSQLARLWIRFECEDVAIDAQKVVWSFGDICYRDGTELWITPKDPTVYTNDSSIKPRSDLQLEITGIELVGNDEMTCIAIDHPDHLYLTTNYIVTHNTFCSLASAATYSERLVISIETRFFNLWAEALSPDSDKQVLDLKTDEVMWVTGTPQLKNLLNLAAADALEGIKVIVVSLRTMANYIETYLRFGKDMLLTYPVLPIDFYKALQAGTAIKDEIHLSLYANFVEELFCHIPRRFSLSATLEDGSFKDKIFGLMFPQEERFSTGPLKQYIDVTALMYRLREPNKAKYSNRGSTDYNHNAYEKWLISDRNRLNNYLRIILEWVTRRFLDVFYFTGQKACVFASSVEMATEIQKFLTKNIPNWKISRYAASAGDVYDESKQADIMVTTEKSFSTGFDLPGLVCALLTVSINSFNTNVQILGRLRELRDHPTITPMFDYLVCEDIPKHVAYHLEKKQTIFKGRVKSHKEAYINIRV